MKSLFKFGSNSGAFAVLSGTWSPTATDIQLNPQCDCSRRILTPSPHHLYRPRCWLWSCVR
jgi:hypothetical protein